MPIKIWKKANKKVFYKHFIPLLPNIIALPFMGGILGDYFYETYEATIIGMIIAFSIGLYIKFKLSSVSSAILWTFFGMFIALGYTTGEEDNAYERFKYYGTLGAILGVLLSLFVGFLIGAVQGLLGKKAAAEEFFDEDDT